MKKISYYTTKMLLFITIAVAFNSCLKDTATKTYTYTIRRPLYKTSAELLASVKSTEPMPVKNPGKLLVFGSTIFLAEKEKGIHIIDNTNPAAPVNTGFITIPGNSDIAMYGNTLYADCYSNLFTIDITSPTQAKLIQADANIFPERGYGFTGNNGYVIYDWIIKDTTVTEPISLDKNQGGVYYTFANTLSQAGTFSGSASGQAGSMSGFAIINNYLYTVTTHYLYSISLAQPQKPVLTNTITANGGMETVYPFGDKLFIGSSTGMSIYSVANPGQPVKLGLFSHVTSCDPVITDGPYAYVTLRSGTMCNNGLNELDVLDVRNVNNPTLVKSYNLTNPHGLSKDGAWLFICDGKAGLKCFDATDANNVMLKTMIPMAETYDVICYSGIAIVSAADGLYQYDYSNINNIKQLSKIGLSK